MDGESHEVREKFHSICLWRLFSTFRATRAAINLDAQRQLNMFSTHLVNIP